jgi:hypothetical protein
MTNLAPVASFIAGRSYREARLVGWLNETRPMQISRLSDISLDPLFQGVAVSRRYDREDSH